MLIRPFTAAVMMKSMLFALTVVAVAAFPAENQPEPLVREVAYHMPFDQQYHMPIEQINSNRVNGFDTPYHMSIDQQQYHLQMNANRVNGLDVPNQMYHVQSPIVYLLLSPVPQRTFFLRPAESSRV